MYWEYAYALAKGKWKSSYFLIHFRPGACVGGNLSPGSIWTVLGFFTSQPRGTTSLYVPDGWLSVPGLLIYP